MNPELSPGTDVAPDLAGANRPAGELAGWAATVFMGLLYLGGAALCWRRAVGALSNPLEPAALLLVGALVAAAAATARMAWRYRTEGPQVGLPFPFASAILSAAVLGVGAVLSLPGTSPSGLVILWAVLAVEECWAWGPTGWRRLTARRRVTSPTRAGVRIAPPHVSASPAVPSHPVGEKPPADDVTQQLTRRRTADGSELLSGWVRVEMAAGQRSSNVHLAFCPPFARTPRVTVEQLGGPEARIKKVQELPYGARFDLKLAVLSEEAATVLLQFSAEAAAPAGPSTDPRVP